LEKQQSRGLAKEGLTYTFPWRCGSEPGADVLLSTVEKKFHRPWAAPYEEITVRGCFDPFPFEEHRFGAPLTANHANGFALDELSLRVDAGSRTIAHPVAHDLSQVPHEALGDGAGDQRRALFLEQLDQLFLLRHQRIDPRRLPVEKSGNGALLRFRARANIPRVPVFAI
jgi:hypothetical protein